jgi:hypothetical protein
MHHELKIWPQFFALVKTGQKPFEIRRDDRQYAVGDTLVLREWRPEAVQPAPPDAGTYTGRVCEKVVTYIMHGGRFGIEPGFVVMAIE